MAEPTTHTQTSTRDSAYTSEGNKLTVRVHFWDAQQRYGFINIDPSIIEKLHITADTILTQEIQGNTIILRRSRE